MGRTPSVPHPHPHLQAVTIHSAIGSEEPPHIQALRWESPKGSRSSDFTSAILTSIATASHTLPTWSVHCLALVSPSAHAQQNSLSEAMFHHTSFPSERTLAPGLITSRQSLCLILEGLHSALSQFT